MNKYLYSTAITSAILLSGCGGSDNGQETQFYKKQESIPQKLEVSIEAVSYTHLTLPTIYSV